VVLMRTTDEEVSIEDRDLLRLGETYVLSGGVEVCIMIVCWIPYRAGDNMDTFKLGLRRYLRCLCLSLSKAFRCILWGELYSLP